MNSLPTEPLRNEGYMKLSEYFNKYKRCSISDRMLNWVLYSLKKSFWDGFGFLEKTITEASLDEMKSTHAS